MIKNTFSPNQIETWLSCPQKFYFKYIKNINMPEKSEFFRLGKRIHTMVYYYLNGFDVSKFESVLTKEEMLHWQNLKELSVLKLDLVACEWEFNVPIDKFWLNGVIDAVFYDQIGKRYLIADWKTGKSSYEKEDFQQMIYMLALYKAQDQLSLDILQSDIVFQYIKTLDNNHPPLVTFSAEKEIDYKNRILDVINKILSDKEYVQLKSKNNCAYCPYKQIC